ncbi:amidohydrolase [Methylobacterium nigriterrae]|uniref:amidohydrolase n=1 Tax=Methylobacterium nigriterrae TaxID=3127512 RepID=UPI003014107B
MGTSQPTERKTAHIIRAALLLGYLSSYPVRAADAPDTIYINGRIITSDAENNIVEAVAVKGDKIQAAGRSEALRMTAGPPSRIVDLRGKTMIPGIIDPHSHFPLSANTVLFQVDLSSPPVGKITSIDDIIAALKKKAEQTPPGQWIVGVGYDDTLLAEKRHPTRQDLDKVSEVHPIYLMHVSYHFGAANTKALGIAEITRDTSDPAGAKFRRDGNGEPTGVLEELSAYERVTSRIPSRSAEQWGELIKVAAQQYASQGVTTAEHGFLADQPGILSDPGLLPAFARAIERGDLPIRIIVWPGIKFSQKVQSGQVKAPDTDSSWLKVGATKMFADGSIQGFTGYLTKPYHIIPAGYPSDYHGHPAMPRDELVKLVVSEHKAGKQIAIHGNGDAAIDDILYAYEQAQKEQPRPDARHIVVHSQTAREDQLDKMKALGVTPSFFSLHVYYWGDRHRDIFLGPDRAARISPARSALQRGLRFTIHTDTPVVPMEPFRLMWAAVNRITASGARLDNEGIAPMQALRALTADAAWQAFEETRRGSIESGKLADLAILSDDPLSVDPMKIKDIKVLETIVGGKTVYQSQ